MTHILISLIKLMKFTFFITEIQKGLLQILKHMNQMNTSTFKVSISSVKLSHQTPVLRKHCISTLTYQAWLISYINLTLSMIFHVIYKSNLLIADTACIKQVTVFICACIHIKYRRHFLRRAFLFSPFFGFQLLIFK